MVSVSTGTVIPVGDIKTVQPLEEGIVLGIFVTDGQHVEQGDPLIEMDTAIEEVDQNTNLKRTEELSFRPGNVGLLTFSLNRWLSIWTRALNSDRYV